MLADKIDAQRTAVAAHRDRLGIGEYSALVGVIVRHNCRVDYRDDTGKAHTLDGATVHIDKSMVAVWPSQAGGVCSFLRRLGAPGFKIDGK